MSFNIYVMSLKEAYEGYLFHFWEILEKNVLYMYS